MNSNKIEDSKLQGFVNGHEYVDLGLSVKWATCNVGAALPSDFGDYYAWGETTSKREYDRYNSVTYEKHIFDIAGNFLYDVARAKWGGGWRLPTETEMQELVDKCDWEWITINGNRVCKVTSRVNGESIFLPAAGLYEFELMFGVDIGYYWSCKSNSIIDACQLVIDDSDDYITIGDVIEYIPAPEVREDWRYSGLSVRPVIEL